MRGLKPLWDGALNRGIRWGLMGLIRLAFRPKIHYVSEKARQSAFTQPMIMVSNHVRGMDGAALCTLFPGRKIHGVSAREFMEKPLLGWLLRRLGCISVDRDHVTLDWLRQCKRILVKDHEHVYICPEGKCNFQKRMQPFKPGAVTLAYMAHAPLLPVYHNGEYHYFFGKRFRCMVGEPFILNTQDGALDAEGIARETRRLEQEVLHLRDLLEART